MRLAFLAAFGLTALSACATTPVAQTSGPFLARNHMWVTPTGPGTFHVAKGAALNDGPADFWCAAGDYVSRGLAQGPTTEIFRASPPPRHAGQGVDFTLNGKDAQPSGITRFNNTSPGFTAGAATGGLCEPAPAFFFP